MEDLPAIARLASLWGRDGVACPYCHGWEARDKAVAVLGSGPRAWRHLLLLLRFASDLALISNGPAGLDDVRFEYLRRAGVGSARIRSPAWWPTEIGSQPFDSSAERRARGRRCSW
jgi:hypothetical protein